MALVTECVSCGKGTRVMEKRNRKGVVYRRRACIACGYRITTYEVEKSKYLLMEKRLKTLEQTLKVYMDGAK